jgi:hypothetical protein
MGIFDIPFSDVWRLLTPPILRQERTIAWGNVLTAPLQYLRDLTMDDYTNGSPYLNYSNVSAYTAGDRVIFTDGRVFENLTGSTGVAPNTGTTTWSLINENYVGARERVTYNAGRLVFTNALNKHFQSTQIYLSQNDLKPQGIIMGLTGPYSTPLGKSNTNIFTPESVLIRYYSGTSEYAYTINVPSGVTATLASTEAEAKNIIRSYADQFNIAGIQYDIDIF